MGVLNLSDELLCQILAQLSTNEIENCELTCRTFRRLVTKSSQLQYRKELDYAQTADNFGPGTSHHEKLQTLRASESAWRTLRLQGPYELSFGSPEMRHHIMEYLDKSPAIADERVLSNGVFFQFWGLKPLEHGEQPHQRDMIVWTSLPTSPSTDGTHLLPKEFQHGYHRLSAEQMVLRLYADVSQDLVALIIMPKQGDGILELHITSLTSEFGPHPLAEESTLTFFPDYICTQATLAGRGRVLFLFTPTVRMSHRMTVIDWIEGTQRIIYEEDPKYEPAMSFAILSDRAFCVSLPYEGCIDVVRFTAVDDSRGDTITRFMFPTGPTFARMDITFSKTTPSDVADDSVILVLCELEADDEEETDGEEEQDDGKQKDDEKEDIVYDGNVFYHALVIETRILLERSAHTQGESDTTQTARSVPWNEWGPTHARTLSDVDFIDEYNLENLMEESEFSIYGRRVITAGRRSNGETYGDQTQTINLLDFRPVAGRNPDLLKLTEEEAPDWNMECGTVEGKWGLEDDEVYGCYDEDVETSLPFWHVLRRINDWGAPWYSWLFDHHRVVVQASPGAKGAAQIPHYYLLS